jgi:Flp pilus assembly protein TadD
MRAKLVFLVAACVTLAGPARADDDGRAREAREATFSLDVRRAHELLDAADASQPSIALERARLAIYDGDYDSAVALLSRSDLQRSDAGAELLGIAAGCARATAGAITEVDAARGVTIRMQDESDRALAPFMVDVAVAVRESLKRDLKVELPQPLHIELVRDLFTLAAMTGLPESAAQKTGTVAVAKWGRVTMISPRAVSRGYPWADTLAHEMAHLAQTRASGDRAPLWLQEGVAKRQEVRWREGRKFDDFPGADVIAAIGVEKKLAPPIDQLGGSIALLPTAEQAMVAFAEVASFIRFFVKSTGDDALAELLVRIRSAETKEYVDEALRGLTGESLSDWNARWVAYLGTVKHDLPPGVTLGGGTGLPREAEIRRGLVLGELLRRRSHPGAARATLGPAQKLAPFDPLLRHHLATALFALGEQAEAEKLISRMEDVHSEFGPWLSLHGQWLLSQGRTDEAAAAFRAGVELCPLDPQVACEGKMPPEAPEAPNKAPLCQAARSVLQD